MAVYALEIPLRTLRTLRYMARCTGRNRKSSTSNGTARNELQATEAQMDAQEAGQKCSPWVNGSVTLVRKLGRTMLSS